MQKRWVEQDVPDKQTVEHLIESLHIDEVLATLLAQRAITDFEEAKTYFRPELTHLHDPFLMKDMEKAIVRIEQAINTGERVLIYGDYDVDGTTSVALVFSFFRKYLRNINFYIPDRYKEGYGISTIGIDYAAANNFSLIIALDCGIKSNDKVDYAKSLGVDFIICDHHLPGESIPDAVAVLDPKRKDCEYPFKELSGCGIGFKLIEAYSQKNDIPFDDISCYLDLVAVSIASDIVPITGENRVLAAHGLKKINSEPCNGLQALMEVAGKTDSYTITDIVFAIGPRINAAGRIDDAKHAVNLLIADTQQAARDKGFLINLKNTERKEHDLNITEHALEMIATDDTSAGRKTTVVYHETWHKGVIGIVASRLTEKYYRPTVVLTKSNEHVAGSARSVMGFDLYEALSSCSDLLEQFGGHKYAAGLTMKPENVTAFIQRFEEVVSQTIADELLIQEIRIDATIKLKQISSKFFRILNQFAPFGPGNMAPVFRSKGVSVVCGQAGIVGTNHLKMNVTQEDSPIFECIAFGLGKHLKSIEKGIPFDICYTIEERVWKEKRSIQLNIKDIRTYDILD
ncbi:single-stranded-DNA-specific exonuclease RecJ [Pedobacter sp. HMF7647]|uniref:Single-stranded-DNA-specific exonuclease RecJ n=1 Tax=Hufsiella arboris TaxID=2695275 RepID=A0A7K1YAD5_9SPHI|nr:single-stranded-DNA-specific exonuclease RecJ [Hufsiella arboris]MXV51079.1 single-stranded-DNA-specific exonuclease RecJ [Hufsiella arboris]